MRVLIYDRSKDVEEDFVNTLLPEGFEVITVKKVRDISKIATVLPLNIVVLEVVEEDAEMTALLAKMKSDDKYSDIKVIVSTLSPTKEFIAGMIQIGVDGFLLKPCKRNNLLERFYMILSKMGIEIKHQHVIEQKVKATESLVLSFRTNKRQIITNVATISAKGLSFNISKDTDAEFMIGDTLSNIQFDIAGLRFIISAVVKDKRDRKCILKFENITEKCLDVVCKYIHEEYMREILNNKGNTLR